MKNHQLTLPPDRFSDLAALGLRVIPIRSRSKRPALDWLKYQSEAPTIEDIARWDASNYNVAVVTGLPGGVVVLDVDDEEAQDFADTLDLPLTATVRTARGRHYYYRPPLEELRNAAGVEGLKLDVRATGGYVVAPGSLHPDGTMYEWENSPADVGFAPFPGQLLPLLKNKERAAPSSRNRAKSEGTGGFSKTGIGGFIAQELSAAVNEIGAASEGVRNDTLFKMAARMARHVSAADVDWSAVSEGLAVAAESVGLGEKEIANTLESGWKKGSNEPTAWIRVAEEHVYLGYQERFHHMASGQGLRPAGFHGLHGHEYFGRGNFANFLLRANYIKKVHDVTYEPTEPERFIERDGLEYLNTYRPSDVVAIEGDAGPFKDFLAGLVPAAEEREHLVKMIAFTVRNPGKKLRYALLLRSAAQGVGKSMLADIWGRLLGMHNVRKATPQEIASDYQGYLPQTLLVLVEEMNFGAGHKTYNSVKDMITGDTFTVNEKHLRQRQWPIYASFVFFSNLDQPLLVEANDRRIYYVDSPAQPRGDQYYVEFAAWWSENLGVIRGYLDSIDLESFNPHKPPPMTDAKLALIAGSKSELAQDLEWAMQERQGVFDRDLVKLEHVMLQFDRKWSERALSKALKEAGVVHLGQQRVGGRRLSLWAVRNANYWRFVHKDAWQNELESLDGGMFAFLEGTGMEAAHVTSSSDPAALIAGFEEEFYPPDSTV